MQTQRKRKFCEFSEQGEHENLFSDSDESDWLPSLNPSLLVDFTALDLDFVGMHFS